MTDKTTHFGFEQVGWNEKVRRVGAVFDSVAGKYDVMNDVMSLGIHRCGNASPSSCPVVRKGSRVLDLAGGTGDLAARLARIVGADGEVVLADINAAMLEHGRARLLDEGIAGNVRFVQANASACRFRILFRLASRSLRPAQCHR